MSLLLSADPERRFLMPSETLQKLMIAFDWSEWSDSFGSKKYHGKQASIATASLADCLCLITTIVHSERLCSGVIHHCATDGTLQAILDRLEHFAQ